MGSAWSSLGTGTAAVALYARGNRKSALVCALLFLAIRYRKGIIAYLVVRGGDERKRERRERLSLS